MSPKQVAELAFQLYEQKRISREDLVAVLEGCVNAVALANGYADVHGLPFPEDAKKEPSNAP